MAVFGFFCSAAFCLQRPKNKLKKPTNIAKRRIFHSPWTCYAAPPQGSQMRSCTGCSISLQNLARSALISAVPPSSSFCSGWNSIAKRSKSTLYEWMHESCLVGDSNGVQLACHHVPCLWPENKDKANKEEEEAVHIMKVGACTMQYGSHKSNQT